MIIGTASVKYIGIPFIVDRFLSAQIDIPQVLIGMFYAYRQRNSDIQSRNEREYFCIKR